MISRMKLIPVFVVILAIALWSVRFLTTESLYYDTNFMISIPKKIEFAFPNFKALSAQETDLLNQMNRVFHKDVHIGYGFEYEINKTITETQRQRFDTMRDFCLHKRQQKLSIIQENLGLIVLMENDKVLEHSISKTGSTMRSRYIWRLFHPNETDTKHFVHSLEDKNIPHISWKTFKMSPVYQQQYFNYMFVREPMHRILSAIYARIGSVPKEGKTIERYFQNILHRFWGDGGNHFLPITEFADVCHLNFSFIGRQETHKRDFEHIVFNATTLWKSIGEWVKENSAERENSAHYSRIFDTRVKLSTLLQLVLRYQDDYKAFGYNPWTSIEYAMKILNVTQG